MPLFSEKFNSVRLIALAAVEQKHNSKAELTISELDGRHILGFCGNCPSYTFCRDRSNSMATCRTNLQQRFRRNASGKTTIARFRAYTPSQFSLWLLFESDHTFVAKIRSIANYNGELFTPGNNNNNQPLCSTKLS